MKKFFISAGLGVALILSGIIFSLLSNGHVWVGQLMVALGTLLLIVVLLIWVFHKYKDASSEAIRDNHVSRTVSSEFRSPGKPPGVEINLVADELRKQVERLSAYVGSLQQAANSAEMERRLSSLQNMLVESQAELKKAKASLSEEKKLHESAEDAIAQAHDENARLQSELNRLTSELAAAIKSQDKLISAESNRLAQMVPAGLLDSSVGQTVAWCAEAAAKGDRVAAQIFASLQSIKAAQGDDELKGLLLSSLQVLGQSLTRLAERQDYSPEQKYDVLSSWSSVLNEIASSRFTLIVPSIGARLNLNTMVSNGAAVGNVNVVHCWGVMNENRDLYSPALVS
jgi:hypothetical protein